MMRFQRSSLLFAFCSAANLSLILALAGCAALPVAPPVDNSIKLVQILDQINEAIQVARHINGGKGPRIESVELELQLAATDSVSGNIPVAFVTPTMEVDKGLTQKIQLTFVPKDMPDTPGLIDPQKISPLAATIAAISQAVLESSPRYDFRDGSAEIQCTLTNDKSVSIAGISKLIPVKLGGTHNKESTQTVTLNFAPSETAAVNAAPNPRPPSANDSF